MPKEQPQIGLPSPKLAGQLNSEDFATGLRRTRSLYDRLCNSTDLAKKAESLTPLVGESGSGKDGCTATNVADQHSGDRQPGPFCPLLEAYIAGRALWLKCPV